MIFICHKVSYDRELFYIADKNVYALYIKVIKTFKSHFKGFDCLL